MWFMVSLVMIILILLFLHGLICFLKDEQFEKIPGPKGTYIVENGFDFLMDSPGVFYYFRHLGNKYKDLFKFKLGHRKFVVVYNPEDIETVISGTKFNNKGYVYMFLQPWLKDGLLLSKGEKWHQRRKILTPAFHFNILRQFSSILIDNSEKLVKKLELEVDKEKSSLQPLITDFTLNSICETAMGISLEEETNDIGQTYKDAIHELGTYLVYRGQRFWLHPKLTFNLSHVGKVQKKVLKMISSFRDRVIQKRRENNEYKNLFTEIMNDNDDVYTRGKKRLAMLDLLLEAEKNGDIDSEGINEEVDTFMFEGHDTTSAALLFAFMLLANHPNDQERVVEEINQIFGSSDRRPTMSDLTQMKYLESCIKETMRLYPPVFFIDRATEIPLKLKDYECSAGTNFTIMIYELHRRGDQFVDPLSFRPERFLQEPTWHQFSYIPFSAGPRNCIGQKFAMMEMKYVISAVLRHYRLLPVTKPKDLVFKVDVILRPQHDIYVKFEKRV